MCPCFIRLKPEHLHMIELGEGHLRVLVPCEVVAVDSHQVTELAVQLSVYFLFGEDFLAVSKPEDIVVGIGSNIIGERILKEDIMVSDITYRDAFDSILGHEVISSKD